MKFSVALRLIKHFRGQRDECADALRNIMAKIRADCGDLSDDPMAPFAYDAEWEQLAIVADAALAKVPTYAERLRRIIAFVRRAA